MRNPANPGPVRELACDNETKLFRADTWLAGALICMSVYLALTTASRLLPGFVPVTSTTDRVSR